MRVRFSWLLPRRALSERRWKICPETPCHVVFSSPLPPSLEAAKAAGLAEIEPDKECLADDIRLRHESPHPAVAAAVPVIAHHEIMSRRHRAGHSRAIVNAIVAKWELLGVADQSRLVVVENYGVLNPAQAFDVLP